MHLLISEHHLTGACRSSPLAAKPPGRKSAELHMKALLLGGGLFLSPALLDFIRIIPLFQGCHVSLGVALHLTF